jgi:hypothetical protein
LQLAGAVFRYAVATARLASDPTRDLRGALTAPTVTHYGAIIDPARLSAWCPWTLAQNGASGRVGFKVWIGFWRYNGTQYVSHWPFAEWIAHRPGP